MGDNSHGSWFSGFITNHKANCKLSRLSVLLLFNDLSVLINLYGECRA